jgi:hypothetical protein
MSTMRCLWLGVALSGGCNTEVGEPNWGNQIGQAAACAPLSAEETVGFDEVIPEGFSAAEFFDAHTTLESTLVWFEGGTWSEDDPHTPLVAHLDPVVDSEIHYIVTDCGPEIELQGDLELQSDDGDLADLVRMFVTVTAGDEAKFYVDLPGDSLNVVRARVPASDPTEFTIQAGVEGDVFGGLLTVGVDNGEGGMGEEDFAVW